MPHRLEAMSNARRGAGSQPAASALVPTLGEFSVGHQAPRRVSGRQAESLRHVGANMLLEAGTNAGSQAGLLAPRLALALLALASIAHAAQEWRHWAGDAGATRYSPLKQINRSNVQKLRVAWT